MTNLDTQIVLFGSGEIGRRALQHLRSIGRTPACFADSNPERQGTYIDGIPVFAPEVALMAHRDSAWVATVLSLPASIEVPNWIRHHGCRALPLADVLPPASADAPYRFGPHFGRIPNPRGVEEARNILADVESIAELRRQQSFYLRPDYGVEQHPRSMDELYFPDFIGKIENEHFVDCGAADGDSVALFLDYCGGKFNAITAIEPDPRNFAKLSKNFPGVRRICGAVSDSEGTLKFNANGDYTSRLSVGGDGDITVPVHTIDGLALNPPPTFIKMDVEGFEPEALWGARQTLRDHAPVLAICCYHDTDHFWQIPLLIRSLQPGYRLFFRRYASVPFELICYAVPERRLR